VRVLVGEDEVLLSRQLASALGEAGYAVDCAADGERADFLGQTEQYDAVILDLGLPKIDGLGVRADEAAPGSGLGLAIVRDLAELYGGSIALSRSAAGGVRARLQLPSC
jgi:two-component system, OmpR family, response regulator